MLDPDDIPRPQAPAQDSRRAARLGAGLVSAFLCSLVGLLMFAIVALVRDGSRTSAVFGGVLITVTAELLFGALLVIGTVWRRP